MICDYPNHITGEVAEWSKAAALGAALFGGVGSNPILVNFCWFSADFVSNWQFSKNHDSKWDKDRVYSVPEPLGK